MAALKLMGWYGGKAVRVRAKPKTIPSGEGSMHDQLHLFLPPLQWALDMNTAKAHC